MSHKAYTSYNYKNTSVREPVPAAVSTAPQVQNNEGSFVFALDNFKRLERFLILGTEGGSYYTTEAKLTKENAKCIEACLKENPDRVLELIADVRRKNRAFKQDPWIFALAICASFEKVDTRQKSLGLLNELISTPTQLFHFITFVEQFRGWGRTLKGAIANWYNSKKVDRLAYSLTKYQQRDSWNNKDVLRKAHPKPPSDSHKALYNWVVGKEDWNKEGITPPILYAFEEAKTAKKDHLLRLISDFNMSFEMVPNSWSDDREVQYALARNMGETALLRSLGKLTSVGVLSSGLSEATNEIAQEIAGRDFVIKGRIHPMSILLALKVYQQGHGERGKLTWKPARPIVDALDTAFYNAFQGVWPTEKRVMFCIDVSHSMSRNNCVGSPFISAREGSSALALVSAASEKRYDMWGFTNKLIQLDISPKERLDDVIKKTRNLDGNNTYTALPIEHAIERRLEVDAFVMMTDNEVNAGRHPVQALKEYRQKSGIPAKLIINGMTSSQFSVADPNDAGCLDCVGFDANAPAVISNFIRE